VDSTAGRISRPLGSKLLYKQCDGGQLDPALHGMRRKSWICAALPLRLEGGCCGGASLSLLLECM
jgi:hypothetical protein